MHEVDSEPPGGRASQKARTRRAVIDSAAALLAQGTAPSIGEAAAAAGVSRATAYRYFSSQGALLVEAARAVAEPDVAAILASAAEPDQPESRVEALAEGVFELVTEHEAAFRALHAAAIAGDAAALDRRRIAWAEEALAPLRGRLSTGTFDGLVRAVTVYLGVESVLVLRDVCGLPPGIARSITGWAARAMVRAAEEEAGLR